MCVCVCVCVCVRVCVSRRATPVSTLIVLWPLDQILTSQHLMTEPPNSVLSERHKNQSCRHRILLIWLCIIIYSMGHNHNQGNDAFVLEWDFCTQSVTIVLFFLLTLESNNYYSCTVSKSAIVANKIINKDCTSWNPCVNLQFPHINHKLHG